MPPENPLFPDLPAGPYRTIVLDPPWPLTKFERKVRPRQQGFDYPTLTLAEISSLPLPGLLDQEAFVFLWTTQKYLPAAYPLLQAWGLKYRFTMTWHKPGGIQPLNSPQFNSEFVVVGSKGKALFTDLKAFNTAFQAPRAGHSIKPEEFYELIKRTCPPPRLDIFSRRSIPGFDRWGNEKDAELRYKPPSGENPEGYDPRQLKLLY